MVSVGTVVWLSSELMFFAGLFAMYFTLRAASGGGAGGSATLYFAAAIAVQIAAALCYLSGRGARVPATAS